MERETGACVDEGAPRPPTDRESLVRLATPLLQVPPAGGPAVLVAIDADLRSGEPTVIQGLTEQIRDICITQLDAVALAL